MRIIIDTVDIFFGFMPVDLTFSYGKSTRISFVIVRLRSGEHVGTGEGLGIGIEQAEPIAKQLLGQDAIAVDALLPAAPSPWAFAASVPREMFSLALHDLVSRVHNKSMRSLVRETDRTSLPMMPCIFADEPDEAAKVAATFAAQGFKHFKTKLFGNLQNDAAIAKRIRKEIGDAYLQADLNCFYKDQASAITALHALHDAGLDVIEDIAQLPHEQLAELRNVSDRPRLMIDAVHRGHENMQRTIQTQCAEMVNLHPNCQGTVSEICQRADAFRAAGFEVVICGTGYTGVGTHAHLQLATCFNDDGLPFGDVGGHRDHGMPTCTAAEPLAIRDGEVVLQNVPGHGGEIDEASLVAIAEKVTLRL